MSDSPQPGVTALWQVPDLLEDLDMRAPDRNPKADYISPVLYPQTAHLFSEDAARRALIDYSTFDALDSQGVDDYREQINVVC